MPGRVFLLRDGAEAKEVAVESRRPDYRVRFGGRVESFGVARLPDGRVSLLFEDGRQVCGRGTPVDPAVLVVRAGERRLVSLAEPLADRLAHAPSESGARDRVEEVRALMPGRIVEVVVAAGDRVEPGALLLVLEAMKMQNEIRARSAGVVERAEVRAGQTVDRGALMVSVRSDSI